MHAPPLRGALALSVLLLTTIVPVGHGSTGSETAVVRVASRTERGRVAVFSLDGIDARRVQRATLLQSSRRIRRSIPMAAVRSAAARGVLRIGVTRSRRAAANGRSNYRVSFVMRARRPKKPAPVLAAAPALAPITTWRPPAAPPLSDADAAQRVRAAAATHAENAEENAYRPSAAELDAFRNGQTDRYGRTALQYNPLTAYVTGAFSGTEDEIFQWVAQKWGIPEDIVRSIAVNESR
jgi:hypothetical protein